MIDPDDLLDAVLTAMERQPRPTRLGKIDPAYASGDPKVVWDGETVATTKTYKALGSYTPHPDDRIIAVQAGSTWVILGRVGGGDTWEVGDLKITSRSTWSDDWLLADGSTFSGTTYPLLQTHLGGTTLPDWRDRVPAGAGGDFALDATGGTKPTNVAQHQHNYSRRPTAASAAGGTSHDISADALTDHQTSLTGTTNTHGNYPPYRAVNVLIRAR